MPSFLNENVDYSYIYLLHKTVLYLSKWKPRDIKFSLNPIIFLSDISF